MRLQKLFQAMLLLGLLGGVWLCLRTPADTSAADTSSSEISAADISEEGFVRVDRLRNLIANPGFELASRIRSKPQAWSFHEPGADTLGWELAYPEEAAEAHSGRRSIRISHVFSRDYWRDRGYIESAETPLDSSKKYLGRIWYRTENVRHGKVSVRIRYKNSRGKMPRYAERKMRLDAANEWTPFDFPLEPPNESAPYDTKSFHFRVLLDHSPGTLWVDDVGVWELTPKQWQTLYPFGRYRPPLMRAAATPKTFPAATFPAATFPAAKTITVRQDDEGVWWFVRPDGTPFYYTATGMGADENDFLAAYVERHMGLTPTAYRNRARFLAGRDLEFSANFSPQLGAAPVNHIKWLNFSTAAKLDGTDWVLQDRDGEIAGGRDHFFPDPWSAAWRANTVREAKRIEARHALSPEVIGYYTDNEWVYGEMSDYFWSNAARVALVRWLQGQLPLPPGYERKTPYRAIAEVNEAWSSAYHTYTYSSFEDIYGDDKPRIRAFDDPVAADLYGFERVVFKKYVDTVVAAIRTRERQLGGEPKLIFSSRISWAGPGPGDEFFRRNADILAAFDVIALNVYPTLRLAGDHQPRSHMETMRELFVVPTGRPVLVSEFGMGGSDVGIPVRRWRKKGVHTQAERGQGYHNLSATWANTPWMVGQTWFKWANGYGSGGKDPRNCGLVDDQGQYYTELTEAMTSTHRALKKIGRRGDFSAASVDWRPLTYPVYESAPPALEILEPDGQDDEAADRYEMTWTASDADGPATVTLFVAADPATAANTDPVVRGLVVGVQDSFVLDVSKLTPGRYFVVGAVDDGSGPPRWATSLGALTVVSQGSDEL